MILNLASWPSGKARVRKTLIQRFNSFRRLSHEAKPPRLFAGRFVFKKSYRRIIFPGTPPKPEPDHRSPFLLRDHLKDHGLVVTIDFFQPGIFRSNLQEVSMLKIGMDIARAKDGGNGL